MGNLEVFLAFFSVVSRQMRALLQLFFYLEIPKDDFWINFILFPFSSSHQKKKKESKERKKEKKNLPRDRFWKKLDKHFA